MSEMKLNCFSGKSIFITFQTWCEMK